MRNQATRIKPKTQPQSPIYRTKKPKGVSWLNALLIGSVATLIANILYRLFG